MMHSTEETLNIPPRPVFFEELNLLGLDKYWSYPETAEPLLWACGRHYFYRGKLVLKVKGGNMYDAPQLIFPDGGKNQQLKPINMDSLCKKNKSIMFLLEHEAMEFINTVYIHYRPDTNRQTINESVDFQQLADIQEKKGKGMYVVIRGDCDSFDIMPLSKAEEQGKTILPNMKIEMFIVSFSGGKDSQVVLDLVSRVLPPHDFPVIYSDTGYEIPPSLEIYEETKKYYQKQHPDLKFYLSKNHRDALYYWGKIGPPSRIHRWCCSVMKSAPLSRKVKEISRKDRQPGAVLFDGVRAEESNNRANRARVGKNVKHNNIINASPILYWNATEIYLYLFAHKLPINQGYRNGLSRVGCVICPYSSSWSEGLCGKLYPDVAAPFIGKLKGILANSKVSRIDNYIKSGYWKMRAGGRDIVADSAINIIVVKPDFKAVLNNPQERILTWIKVLGKYYCTEEFGIITGDLKYKNQIFRFAITKNENNSLVEFKDAGDEVLFISHLKKVLNKSVHCIHCEACEVECPTGALSVVPIVTVDENKCIHCFKCLDFNRKGCVIASSINISTNNNYMKTSKTGINRYNAGIGLRETWLRKYFNNYEKFFEDDSHGINVQYQMPPLINWLKDANILQSDNKLISDCGKLLLSKYATRSKVVWEIIFINLCYNSEICNWFHSHICFERTYLKSEMEVLLQESYPELKDRTVKNPFDSLLNTFKESPLGKEVSVGLLCQVDKKPALIRHSYNDVSPVAVAYSLYCYAEKNKRYNLTVSEFYDREQTEGIYCQFGVFRDTFETILRTLKEDKHRILNADLNMGLDNIHLLEDLTPMDILTMIM